ncbi:Fe3+-hydroxamate ABC transporter substrate-binding protein [Haladaptatus sp. R4]|uniref:ABC transporter substrate-binding protein n=1 Tax=Haladaptatus sp. R4 TaxID=1679489 RepID=UPI0007B4C963|nr:ABC transporter substrate-binding protein [Haladaptatus sp. R4]KZN22777.1 Fe3+-hydroxamate ABC transporter substrate-binding protein [Haladaptatus sp. R4]
MVADDPKTTSRRRYLFGCGVAGATIMAGCLGGDESSGAGTDTTNTSETTGSKSDGTSTETTETETSESGPYSVSMEPVGSVKFDSVPKSWVANNGSWADMGIALGLEPPKAVWLTSRYHTQYYDEIPGVSMDKSGMKNLYQDGVNKELFYQLDGDVHVIDPNFLMNRFKGWSQSDVDEVEKNIGPFFGNSIFSTGYKWHKDYTYYSLYEAFEKLAKVFKRTDRYEAFKSLHADFQSNLESVVPSKKSKRPSVAIMWANGNKPESFSPYLISEGTSFKQWRDLKVQDAFANTDVRDFHATRGEVDFETLLKIDPDVLLLRGHENQTKKEFQNTVVEFMKNHKIGKRLTAVKNDDVYRGGGLYQGPITNLVLTERAAKQVYDASGDLYDKKRVASIVKGDM